MTNHICWVCSVSLIIQKIFLKIVTVHEVIISWSLCVCKHVKSNIVRIVIICLEVIKLYFGVLQPFISILEHIVIKALKIFQLVLNVSKILF
jgi:hypothetical protein